MLPALDLDAIGDALRELDAALPGVDERLGQSRAPLGDIGVSGLLAAYARLGHEIAAGRDLFAWGHSARLLALNHLVLYGATEPPRERFRRAFRTSEQRFYEAESGGIGALADWRRYRRGQSPLHRAAGLYLLVIIDPQLFVEGNHRSAALFASHELMLAGLPPFVLDAGLAEALFALTPELQGLSRASPALPLRARRLLRRLEALIEAGSRPGWVLPAAAARADVTDPLTA